MVFTAELALSWATGSGLLICCITGLAVTEVGRGSECRALKEGSLPTFWEQLLDLYTPALWMDMHTVRQISCAFVGGVGSQ